MAGYIEPPETGGASSSATPSTSSRDPRPETPVMGRLEWLRPLIHSGKTVTLLVGAGRIVFNLTTLRMVAICDNKEHSNCFISRTTADSARKGKEYQGAPLAGLLAWLDQDTSEMTRDDHVWVHIPAHKKRQDLRNKLVLDHGYFELLRHEMCGKVRVLIEPDEF